MALPYEGFTIDYVSRGLRSTLLNPFLMVPAACGIFILSPSLPPVAPESILTYAHIITYCLAVTSVILSATEALNRSYDNNWTTKSHWNWNREIVLITGGSSGIGAALAQELHQRNSQTTIVIVDYVPLTWTPAKGAPIHFYPCDLSKSSDIRALCATIRSEVGNPTVLVNNAGLSRGYTICDGSYLDVEITIRTNLIAPFLLIKEVLPEMVRRDHGHIVNVSSFSAVSPLSRIADYAATKAALMAMHEALQLELKDVHKAPRVRLTLPILSFTRTPLFDGETNQSNFLLPVMDVRTVAESIADTLYSGYGKTIYLPGMMRYIAILRGGPEWFWRALREKAAPEGIDFKGRQKVDPNTGGLSSHEH